MKKIIFASLITVLTVSIGYSMSMKNLKSASRTVAQKNSYPFLEFKELKQFPEGHRKGKFDLSGLALNSDGTVYTISDKEKDDSIFKVDWTTGFISAALPLKIKTTLDIEAIDVCGDDYYVSNENDDKFYVVKQNKPTREIVIDFSAANLSSRLFGGNKGYEGLAVDCENSRMYLAKEREPRFILTVDLKTKKVIKRWDIPQDDAFDFSDAKFENGFLYVLERSGMLVTKINLATEQVVAKYSYKNIEKGFGYLFGPAIYSFGEALMLTPSEIWIGFDNNGLRATQQAEKDLGVTGRDPLIMRFKRPAGF
jgi:uncharacterized protein YjiK